MTIHKIETPTELTEGEVTGVVSEKLFLHKVQKVELPLNKNMGTVSNSGYKVSILFFVYCGTLVQRFISWVVQLLFPTHFHTSGALIF
jgi:hypothetical protein